MEKFIGYVRSSRIELRKVIFPVKEQIRTAFVSVLIVVTIISIFLALVDLIMKITISSLVG